MDEMRVRKTLSEVALGNIPPDTLITNGTIFNVFTGEFIAGQSIWIKEGMIAYVGPDHDPARAEETEILDVDGMVLVPGLIDAHTHLANVTAAEYVKHIIPGGTTSIITETSEIGLVAGADGVRCLVKQFEGQPIRFFYTAPPLCGLTPGEEVSAFGVDELLTFLKDPNCVGLGEVYWSNLFIEGWQGDRLWELASSALTHGKRVEGHTAGASGRKLQAYSCLGVSSCHEPITEEEILERIRLGYWVMVREGSIRQELSQVKGIFRKKIDFRKLVLATDSVTPVDIIEKGYLEASLRRALQLGVPPGLAYQMVTINAAEHFHLDDLIGSLSPGRMADMVIIPSAAEYSPRLVMCGGKIIFRNGKNAVRQKGIRFPDYMFNTVRVKEYPPPRLPDEGKIRAIELVTNLLTREAIINLDDPEESRDVILALALERLGARGAFWGLLKGLGLQRGALGSTMCWDTGDMAVFGCDPSSVATVVERLRQTGGGAAYAIHREIIADFSAPICGVLSLEPMKRLRSKVKRLEEALRRNGVRWEKPTLIVDTITTPAIPHLRISHDGYVRLKDRKVLGVNI